MKQFHNIVSEEIKHTHIHTHVYTNVHIDTLDLNSSHDNHCGSL